MTAFGGIRPGAAALGFALGLVFLAAAGPCGALTRTDVYEASAPLADRSEAAQNAAFEAALRTVLVRVTGRRSIEEDAALGPLLASARRYVQQYQARPDGTLAVTFDGPALERWLVQNGEPVWGVDRPLTAVWLTLPSGAVVTADDPSELKAAVDAAASARGIPLLWPSAQDVQRLHPDAAGAAAGTALGELARSLDADAVLAGRASGGGATAAVRWTFVYGDRASDFAGAVEGVNRAADAYAAVFAASGALAPVDIEVAGIGNLTDFAGVESYLRSLAAVSQVALTGFTGDTARFSVSARGGADSLARALRLSGRFLPASGGTEDGVQRYSLRR